MSRDCAIIINPASGGYTEERAEHFLSRLSAAGFVPRMFATRTPDDAALLAARICEEQQDPFVVAAGGDGTINGVLNGLEPGRATLALFPLGTSNVLAGELGIASCEEAVERICSGKTRPVSVGVAKSDQGERRFLLMAGVGFDGAVVHGVRSGEKRLLRQGGYILSAARELLAWDKGMVEVVAGSVSMECHSVIVCNGSRYGGKFLLAPAADVFTPGFQLVCVKRGERRGCLRLALDTLLGRVTDNPDVCRFMAQEVRISGGKPVQLDGDAWGSSPITITALADFARLVV